MNEVAQNETRPPPERPPPSGPLQVFERALLQFYQQADVCVLNRRQRACLRTIRRRSFDRGAPQTEVLDLNFFVEDNSYTGTAFDRAEASRGIDELESMNIISAPAKQSGKRPAGCYGINVLWSAWRAERRVSSGRAEQRIFDLQEGVLSEQLRKDFIEFGGCPPDMPHGLDAVPASRSRPTASEGDCNAGGRTASGGAAGIGGGSAGESESLRRSILAGNREKEIGDSPHDTPAAVRGVGKIPTEAVAVGKIPIGKIPTDARAVGKIPRAAVSPNVDGPNAVGKIPIGKIPRPGERVSPHTPLPKALSAERLTLNAKRSALTAQAKVSREREAELMERLTAWLGVKEMAGSGKPGEGFGGMWRTRWVRNYPDEVESEMRWGQQLEMQQHPDRPRNRACWLMSRLALIAGVKSVREIAPAAAPMV
jgi:hypothetical protein